MKINANYVPAFDHYRADIYENGLEFEVIEENGYDLVESVKKATGIEIEYMWDNRVFVIPEENSIV